MSAVDATPIPEIGLHKFAMQSPSDVAPLRQLIDAGVVDPREIIVIQGKTEGNGGANDFTRALAVLSLSRLLAPYLDCSVEEASARIPMVWSGGTEGVICPHALVVTRRLVAAPIGGKRLVVGRALARAVPPQSFGRIYHVDAVAEATIRALDDAGISDRADIHLVQVKGPLLTPGMIASFDPETLVTTDPNRSMVYSRAAGALGAAVALGEVRRDGLTDRDIGATLTLFSTVASTSAGGEVVAPEVIVFGNSERSASPYRVGHAVLRDVIDAEGVKASLRNAGLEFGCVPDWDAQQRIAHVFAKAEAAPSGAIRGRRHTMLSDADINFQRHARAAIGAVIASVTGDTANFISGATEHQCAPGEAPIASIVRVG